MWPSSPVVLIPINIFEFSILNLFSRDTYIVDQILARVIQSLFATLAVCLMILVVIGASFPLFLIVIFPLGWLYGLIMK